MSDSRRGQDPEVILGACAPVTGIGTIEIRLRADGLVDMRSTFMGRVDVSAYVPFAQERLGFEVEKLARELREQAVDELRRQTAAAEMALQPSLR